MSDIEKAKELLKNNDFTCVLCKGDTVYTSAEKGISPMLDFIKSGKKLAGFSAADKIIGKAAAMLFGLAGVKEVYGEVMSASGAKYLEKCGITYSYGTLTDKIINRSGNGICPMELTVAEIDDETAAFEALLQKRRELRGEKR